MFFVPETVESICVAICLMSNNKMTELIYQELMSRPKGAKERPTPHYSVQRLFTLNNYHTFLLWNYSQVGSFPLWSLRVGVLRAHFCLMLDVDAGIDDSRLQ